VETTLDLGYLGGMVVVVELLEVHNSSQTAYTLILLPMPFLKAMKAKERELMVHKSKQEITGRSCDVTCINLHERSLTDAGN
jgi:hypothetical protein